MSTSNSGEFWEREDTSWNSEEQERKKNARDFGVVFIVCFIIIVTAVVSAILYSIWTDKVTEYKLKKLNFTVNNYQSGDWVTVNTCKIKVSDAFTIYDSETEIWLPDNKKIIGLHAEIINEEYDFNGGINNPYVNYGEGYYSIPVFDTKTIEFIEKAGYIQDEILSSYDAGYYSDESGYYFFMVDREADTFSFIVDDTTIGKKNIETVHTRNVINLSLDEEGGKNNE